MALAARPGKIIPRGDHTLIIMEDGRDHQGVCIQGSSVTSEQLLLCMGEIERIASMMVERGEIAFDGNIWMLAADILKNATNH